MAKSASDSRRGGSSSMNSIVIVAGLAIGAVLFATMQGGGKYSGATPILDPRLDTDGDGVIEEHELGAKSNSGNSAPNSAHSLDIDGDGVVEDHELDEHFYARHRVSLFVTMIVFVAIIVYLYSQWQKAIAKGLRKAAEAAEHKKTAEAAEHKAAEHKAAMNAAAAAEAAARKDAMNAAAAEAAARKDAMNWHLEAVQASMVRNERKRVAAVEAELVAEAAARETAAETAKQMEITYDRQAAAARRRGSVSADRRFEEDAQIVTEEGNITAAVALAKMEEAGVNPTIKGDFEFACKKKQWDKANEHYSKVMK